VNRVRSIRNRHKQRSAEAHGCAPWNRSRNLYRGALPKKSCRTTHAGNVACHATDTGLAFDKVQATGRRRGAGVDETLQRGCTPSWRLVSTGETPPHLYARVMEKRRKPDRATSIVCVGMYGPGVFAATLSCTLMIFTCQHAKSVTQKLWQQHKLRNFYFISVRAKSPARSLSASVHIPFQAA
jgi:hypothetical protein